MHYYSYSALTEKKMLTILERERERGKVIKVRTLVMGVRRVVSTRAITVPSSDCPAGPPNYSAPPISLSSPTTSRRWPYSIPTFVTYRIEQ